MALLTAVLHHLSAAPAAGASQTPSPSPTPSGTDPSMPSLEPALESAPDFLRPWLSVLIPVAIAAVATWLVWSVLARVLRSHEPLLKQVKRLRIPVFCLLLSLGLLIGTNGLIPSEGWATAVDAALKVGFIASATWLIVVLISVFEASLLEHYDTEDADTRRLAKMKTQVTLLKRVVTAVVLVVGVAIVLMMIPSVQRLGTTILASAGLISVVVGLAVQGVLANVFAGLQVAFTDAIRVDDVVVVETQQGRIQEITLTYVVVSMADGRNMILPSTYFTTKPFENWSRNSSELNGNVLMDLNWNAPVDRIRHRVTQLLEASDLWDGRTGTTQVTGAEGGIIKLTITISARNSGDLYNLKNEIREKIVAELQAKHPSALPHQQHPPVA
ncbi:mechanosensitive ion channel family protein [Galactobacter valiniphilus]|uniref:mechanosensitive ion channel family protein n=1 Tax=Galactobacter valiniphilus TaxID=2676122 RepID=UPI0037367AB8